jgi:hypothetical protein
MPWAAERTDRGLAQAGAGICHSFGGAKRRLVEMAANNARESLDMAREVAHKHGRAAGGTRSAGAACDQIVISTSGTVIQVVLSAATRGRKFSASASRQWGANDFASIAEVRQRFRRARERLLEDRCGARSIALRRREQATARLQRCRTL